MAETTPPDDVDLDRLFHRWPTFESSKDWRKAGFTIVDDGKLLVLGHSSADRYLFKKYGSRAEFSAKEQLEKYQHRIAGAALLRAHIAEHGLRHVVVPQKWLGVLSKAAGRKSPHVVIVERYRLRDADESKARYRKIDDETVRELCTIMFSFRGLDLTTDNAAFTRDDKIAFIDTEYLKVGSVKLRSREAYYSKCVGKLIPTHRRFAEDVWQELVNTIDLK